MHHIGFRALRKALAIALMALVLTSALAGVIGAIASSNPKLPPEKQAMEDRIAAEQAEAAKHPKSKNDSTEVAYATQIAVSLTTPWPTPTVETGIRNVNQSPFQSQEALIENQWQGWINGELFTMYAGNITHTPEQGFVAVYHGHTAGKDFTLEKYLTPNKAGAVKITAVNNFQFTLISENGTTFIFDLPSRTFK